MKITNIFALITLVLSANLYALEVSEFNHMNYESVLIETIEVPQEIDFSTIPSGLPSAETQWVERPYDDVNLNLALHISDKYKIEMDKAVEIVNTAHDQSDEEFPTQADILAIIAIESNFQQHAMHKRSKAKGLMQILYKKASYDVVDNIKDGVWLLREYSMWLPREAAIQAYNVGIGSYKKGIRAYKYLNKYKKAKQNIESIQ